MTLLPTSSPKATRAQSPRAGYSLVSEWMQSALFPLFLLLQQDF
jgi:hypothetical protein